MTDYGVQPTGFIRKPLEITQSEVEAQNITEFGPLVIQTSQSPLGQLNGLMSNLITQLWELAEDVYQSYDPDQAEGVSLDTLGRIRLLSRGAETDAEFRQSITNAGRARIDHQDISRAVLGIEGVEFAQVYSNEQATIDSNGMPPGSVAVAVLGGDDEEIATVVRDYVVPGINTHGNHPVNTVIEGFCRTITLIRPIDVPVTIEIEVSTAKDRFGCPPPSASAIKAGFLEDWLAMRSNGKDVSYFNVRSLIESRFPNVEVHAIIASRDGLPPNRNIAVDIAFIEMASISSANLTITVV